MNYWVNGTLQDTESAYKFSDKAFRGFGVFDTMAVIDETPVHMALHFERLHRHAEILGFSCPYDVETLCAAATTLSKNRTGHHVLSTQCSAGTGGRGLSYPSRESATVCMTCLPGTDPAALPPLNIELENTVRRNQTAPTSRVKSFNYMDNALIRRTHPHADEVILLNTDDHIACGTISNIMIEDIQGQYLTPRMEDGAIDGITLAVLHQTLSIKACRISIEDLRHARYIWMLNSLWGVRPVASLEGLKKEVKGLNART